MKTRDLDLKEAVGDYMVSTVSLLTEHSGGTWFETMVFPQAEGKISSFGDVFCTRYITHEGAEKGHKDVVESLCAGTLDMYGVTA